MQWVRSSRCGPTGDNCVEVDLGRPVVRVRDSKGGDPALLTFAHEQWTAFLTVVSTGTTNGSLPSR